MIMTGIYIDKEKKKWMSFLHMGFIWYRLSFLHLNKVVHY